MQTDTTVPFRERDPGESLPLPTAQLALWVFVATATMLFAAFASAYLVRRTGADWRRVELPDIVWFNTIVLCVSSMTMRAARIAQKAEQLCAVRQRLALTTILGLIFLMGQIVAWRQWAACGIYLPTNPHSSFFYILTGLHGLHLLGGILFLGCALARTRCVRAERLNGDILGSVSTYWHFLGAMWFALLILLSTL